MFVFLPSPAPSQRNSHPPSGGAGTFLTSNRTEDSRQPSQELGDSQCEHPLGAGCLTAVISVSQTAYLSTPSLQTGLFLRDLLELPQTISCSHISASTTSDIKGSHTVGKPPVLTAWWMVSPLSTPPFIVSSELGLCSLNSHFRHDQTFTTPTQLPFSASFACG